MIVELHRVMAQEKLIMVHHKYIIQVQWEQALIPSYCTDCRPAYWLGGEEGMWIIRQERVPSF